jgi:hypothetical protein
MANERPNAAAMFPVARDLRLKRSARPAKRRDDSYRADLSRFPNRQDIV